MDTVRRSTLKIRTLTSDVIRERLLAYERKHGMPSAEFHERYCAGEFPEFPHAEDFFSWEAYYLMGMHDP
jgi:hypothetical protein